MENNLPKNWVETEIGIVGDVITGNTPSKKHPEYYDGEIPWIKPGDIRTGIELFNSVETLTKKGAENARMLPKGAVMVTCIGNLGNIAITGTEMATNQQINSVVFSKYVDDKFGYYACNLLKPWLIQNSTSTTISMVNKTIFSKAPFPLPPLAEQQRIVAKLDELFGHLDSLKKRLENIPTLLKNLKQAILTQAVTGKLTQEWRVGKELEISSLKDIVHMDIGYAFKSKEFEESGIPLLRGQNIEPGALRWKDTVYFPNHKLTEFEHLFINEGDVILAMDRPIVSAGLKLAIAKKEDLPCVLVQRVARFKETEQILNKYLSYIIGSQNFISHLFANQTGTQIPHISGKQILTYKIKVPVKEEQTEIVKRVENLFTKADKIEAQYQSLKTKIDNLPQAILAKAFKGELVAQLDTDGDAKELLAEIQALKESLAKKPKKKVVRKKKQPNA